DHRPVRLGKIVTCVRYFICRRPAPLCRVAVGLRASVFAIDGKTGRRFDRRPIASDLDRTESDLAQSALDGWYRDRNSRLPASVVRTRRHTLLPGSPGKSTGCAVGLADGRYRAGDAGRYQ